jgi:hypothetical protein
MPEVQLGGLRLDVLGFGPVIPAVTRQEALPETAQVLPEQAVPLLRQEALAHRGGNMKQIVRKLAAKAWPAKGKHAR